MGRSFCPICVLEVDDDDGFCPYCGYVFSKKESSSVRANSNRGSTRENTNIGCGIIIGIFVLIFLFLSFLSCIR